MIAFSTLDKDSCIPYICLSIRVDALKSCDMKDYWVIINRKERTCNITPDLTQAALLLEMHVNTLRNKLVKDYYCSNTFIVLKGYYIRSNRSSK